MRRRGKERKKEKKENKKENKKRDEWGWLEDRYDSKCSCHAWISICPTYE